MNHNSFFLTAVLAILALISINAQDQSIQVHYTFDTTTDQVPDRSGNNYDAQLMNQAEVRSLGGLQVLDLGDQNGYLDLGTALGELIAGLDDFTITTALYIDESSNITGNGNFVWTFSTSPSCGRNTGKYISYRVNRQRYALSTGGYSNEVAVVETGEVSRKGVWYQLSYTQSGSVGSLYLDSVVVGSSSTLDYSPKDLGQATSYNWIGRPHFSGDAYLKNAMLSDFRIYNRALDRAEIKIISEQCEALNAAMSLELLREAWYNLSLEDTTEITSDINLPLSMSGEISISWSSSHPDVISTEGKVNRPAAGSDIARVILTACLSKEEAVLYKSFEITVLPYLNPQISVQCDLAALNFAEGETIVKYNLHLPETGLEGSRLIWSSDNTAYVSHDGRLLQHPAAGEQDVLLNLQVTASKEDAVQTRVFALRIPAELNYYAYLFSYFTGNTGTQEAIRFAISFDGFNYKALNNNNPIIDSESISIMGGVRDPHILRGINDTTFYMVVTDMKSALGWSSNHGIVMLKSNDLVNWSHSAVDIAAEFDAFSTINRAWAPQSIYDQNTGKYMLYWSMRSGSDIDVIHYAYANDDFSNIATIPKVLYNSSNSTACIDGDIVYKDGKYHLFYKNEGTGNGIRKAVSDYVNGSYQLLNEQYLQQTTSAVEGSCVFKLYDSDVYILMYDVYSSGRYEFTTSTDLEQFSVISGVYMDFSPRHGTVIPITREETRSLVEEWGYGFDPIPEDSTSSLPLTKSSRELSVWLVPAGQRLYFDLNGIVAGHTEIEAEVLGLDGRQWILTRCYANKDLDCSALMPGSYVLRLSAGGLTYHSLFHKN